MPPLLKDAIFRVLIFCMYGLLMAWMFTLIEERSESVQNRTAKAITILGNEAQEKYNMTDNDFNTFVKKAAGAVKRENELEWTFLNSCGFVFAALITVDKLFTVLYLDFVDYCLFWCYDYILHEHKYLIIKRLIFCEYICTFTAFRIKLGRLRSLVTLPF